MTMPTVELQCDTCAEPTFLYRLCGTDSALCADCFVVAYPPESRFRRGQHRMRTPGPVAAGCLRWMRTTAPVTRVHRLVGRAVR
jgi:hypothetical protein